MAKARGKSKARVSLRAVVYRHARWWIAHCLELDIVAEAETAKQALQDLRELSETQLQAAVEAGDLESVFRPAPPEYWKMFSVAIDTTVPGRPAEPIESFEAREAVLV